MNRLQLTELFEKESKNATDVYLGHHSDGPSYLAELEADIRAHFCNPFLVSAQVMPPGFPSAEVGEFVSGWCLAKRDGYWLVYSEELQSFLCFWGSNAETLGAHGIFGSPLYCWSA
jgi:hypothetical protein